MANKTFTHHERVKVLDGPDKGKEGVVVSCDQAAQTCVVRLDGEDADKTFSCDQLDHCGK